MTPIRRNLTLAAAIAAALTTPSAWAQQRAAETELETVVVTAQKVEQSLVDVPLSISVLGSADLERAQALNMQDYMKQVPGLQLTQSTPGFGRVVMRGINTGGVATTVGVYVDETTFGSSSGLANGAILAADFDTFDVARIEVLRGPQGTLYGASSLGGVLKYVTYQPQFESFEGRARASLESVDDGELSYSGAAMVNIPASDKLAFRASGFYRKIGGFIDSIGTADSDIADDINGSKVSGGRVSMLFNPNERFSLRLSAYIQDIDSHESNAVDADARSGESLYGGLTRSRFVPERADVSYRVYNATAVWDLGNMDLTSATSYGTLQQQYRDDYTLIIADLLEAIFEVENEDFVQQTTSVKRFTQELRLSSHPNELIDWLVGAYYTDEKGLIDQNVHTVVPGTFDDIEGLPVMGVGVIDSKYKEYALFANWTFKFTPKFDLTVGGRYSQNDQDELQNTSGLLFGGDSEIPGDSSESVFTWSFAPKFKLNERVALYARAAKGFRPGGPNALAPNAPPGTPNSYDSDKIVSYEVGVKGDTESRTFGFDVAAFHIDWDDIQLLARVNGVGINTNAGGAKSEGLEASLSLRPVQGLRLTLTGAYTDAKLTEDTDLLLVGGRDGDRLPYTPKASVGLSGEYEWAVGQANTAFVGGSWNRMSDIPASFDPAFLATNDRQRYLDAYQTLDLHAGIDFGKFSIELFGRNLTNDEGKTSADAGTTPNGGIAAGVIRPRSYGLTVTAGF
jgi:outer membrane receptor protein involved in Fe transport